MKILVLGAAGKTGREVTRQALLAGHEVVAFVRQASDLPAAERVIVVPGDAENPSDIRHAATDVGAVISVLGHTSAKRSMAQTTAMQTLVAALPVGSRLVSLTGFGVPDPKDPPIPLTGRLMNSVIRLFPGSMYQDGLQHANVMRASQLDWTLVRAPRLTLGSAAGFELGYFSLSGSDSVARADVAAAMISCLADTTWSRQAPMIRSGQTG